MKNRNTSEKDRLMPTKDSLCVKPDTLDDELLNKNEANFEEHMHVHIHEDGTAHNHYHRHAAGNLSHKHESATTDHTHHCPPKELAVNVAAINEHRFEDEESPLHAHSHRLQSKTILAASDLAYRYANQSTSIFEKISLEAEAGSMLAILGNNGAGKSTLLNIFAGIAKPTQGTTLLAQSNIASMSRREIARHIAYVSQEHHIPHLSVYDQVLLGRRPHISWSVSAYDRLVVSNTIKQLGLADFATRYIDELSGGERQKVHIARALAQEPEVLLLDEPTSALDPKNQMEVFEIVRAVTNQSALATIVVMHDINLALRFCDKFLMMRDGALVAYGGSEVVTNETLSTTYDYALKIESIDGALVALPA